jgi:3-oxoacyl-[acyl-carrier protein] reductase
MSEISTKKTALVTGASRGIGAAIADRLASDGFYVIGTATSEVGAAAITERLGENGRGVILNIADADSVEALGEHLKESGLTPFVVVNNAGVTHDDLMLRMSADEFSNILDTNLTGPFRVIKVLLRGMLKQRAGRIINLGSVVGSMGNAGQTNYAAAKAGLVGFTKSLAREVGGRGITVNCVAPGFIDTDMTRVLDEAQRTSLSEQIPLGRLGQPEDIAAAVSFLAGEGGGYITGETLHVNGGMLMA